MRLLPISIHVLLSIPHHRSSSSSSSSDLLPDRQTINNLPYWLKNHTHFLPQKTITFVYLLKIFHLNQFFSLSHYPQCRRERRHFSQYKKLRKADRLEINPRELRPSIRLHPLC